MTWYERQLNKAAYEFINRRLGISKPDGIVTEDGRWVIADQERQPCCEAIHDDYPKRGGALYRHCKTYKHVANLYGVRKTDLREVVVDELKHLKSNTI